jgi:hypothetical protein
MLFQYPLSYEIGVNQCGVIFLGTPHSGSHSADWSDVLVALGGTFGLRSEIVDHLKTFSPMLLASQKAWDENQKDPSSKAIPIVCFSEALKSKVGLGRRMVNILKSVSLSITTDCFLRLCQKLLQASWARKRFV